MSRIENEPVHLGEVGRGDVAAPAESRVVHHADVDHRLVDHIGDGAQRALRRGHPREQTMGQRPERQVRLGHHPDRGALVDGEVAGGLGKFRDQLHRGGAGADDRDAVAGRVEVVVPGGGVDDLAVEVVDTRDVRGVRLGQEAGRRDQVPRPQGAAVGEVDLPVPGLLVPAGALDTDVEPHVPAHVVLVGDVGGVLLDLGAGGRSRRDQFGFGSKKYEYVVVGTSHARPG